MSKYSTVLLNVILLLVLLNSGLTRLVLMWQAAYPAAVMHDPVASLDLE